MKRGLLAAVHLTRHREHRGNCPASSLGRVCPLTSLQQRLSAVDPALLATFGNDSDVRSSEDGGDDARKLHVCSVITRRVI